MAFGRGHATFTIDTLKLQKDSLPAAVNEPPPVFPELHQKVHPLNENPSNDYDYKLKLKINFISNFRTFHDTKNGKEFLLDQWKEEWSLLPKELRLMSKRKATKKSKVKPNLNLIKKKSKQLNIDLNGFEEKANDDENEEENEEKTDELDIDDDDKPKDAEKKRITDNENEADAEIDVDEEEDMDADEAADYTFSYFDAGDAYEDDAGDDDGDGAD